MCLLSLSDVSPHLVHMNAGLYTLFIFAGEQKIINVGYTTFITLYVGRITELEDMSDNFLF
jgi:hypothetical protein